MSSSRIIRTDLSSVIRQVDRTDPILVKKERPGTGGNRRDCPQRQKQKPASALRRFLLVWPATGGPQQPIRNSNLKYFTTRRIFSIIELFPLRGLLSSIRYTRDKHKPESEESHTVWAAPAKESSPPLYRATRAGTFESKPKRKPCDFRRPLGPTLLNELEVPNIFREEIKQLFK